MHNPWFPLQYISAHCISSNDNQATPIMMFIRCATCFRSPCNFQLIFLFQTPTLIFSVAEWGANSQTDVTPYWHQNKWNDAQPFFRDFKISVLFHNLILNFIKIYLYYPQIVFRSTLGFWFFAYPSAKQKEAPHLKIIKARNNKRELDSLAIYKMLTMWLYNQNHYLCGTCLFKHYSHPWKTLWKAQTIGWCVCWDTKHVWDTWDGGPWHCCIHR